MLRTAIHDVALITQRVLVGLLVGWLMPFEAQAQVDTRSEVFVGYSYLNAKPDRDIDRFGMSGVHVEVFVPLSRRFGPVLDLSGHAGTADAPLNRFGVSEIDVRQLAITTGIRYNGFRWKRLRGAFRGLVGISTGSVSTDLSSELWIEETAFAAALGGSIMLDLTDWVTLRLIQPNLFLTTFGNETQMSQRYSAGLVVRLNQ